MGRLAGSAGGRQRALMAKEEELLRCTREVAPVQSTAGAAAGARCPKRRC